MQHAAIIQAFEHCVSCINCMQQLHTKPRLKMTKVDSAEYSVQNTNVKS